MTVKLQKFIADSGLMSRRAAEREIELGHIKVDGVTAKLGDRIDPDVSRVEYLGRDVHRRVSEYTYIMLNKPAGFVSTMKDEKGRKTVADLVSDIPARVFPVGRLDMYSDGLLLMTDDGQLTNILTHPSGEKEKVYRVSFPNNVPDELLSRLSKPMTITEADGSRRTLLPCGVRLLSRNSEKTVVEMTLYEGRNRQIRRMCSELGLKISRLTRISECGVKLGYLPVGKWRFLTDDEISQLKGEDL